MNNNNKRRFREYRNEVTFSIVLTIILALASVAIVAFTKLTIETEIIIIVSFFLFDLVVTVLLIALRMVNNRLDSLESAARPFLGADLDRVAGTVMRNRLQEVLNLRRDLLEDQRANLPKKEMYKCLIDYTNAMDPKYSDDIVAISSINIEDFHSADYAQDYLEANRLAVSRGISVRRLFLLTSEASRRADIISVVKKHHEALSTGNKYQPPVKWLLKSEIETAHQDDDFAIFAVCAMVVQKGPVKAQERMIDLNPVENVRYREVFEGLWLSPMCKAVDDFATSRVRKE